MERAVGAGLRVSLRPDVRRIRQDNAQVAGEGVGHLAGLHIHLASEPIPTAVRFFAHQIAAG